MKSSQDDQRVTIAEAAKQQAWHLAIAQRDSIENIVIVLAHERDDNASVLLTALEIATDAPDVDNWTMIVMRRDQAIRAVEPFDPELATRLGTPTPMKLTMLVIAHGGWSVVGLGRGVGQA